MSLDEQSAAKNTPVREEENSRTDIRANSQPQNPDPKNSETSDLRNHKLWGAAHWLMKFVAIGWILNAVVSVKIYDKLVKNAPELVNGFRDKSQALFDAMGNAAGKEKWSAKTLKKFSTLGQDFTDVIGTSLGGFLMVPLMAIYSSFQEKIEDVFSRKRPGENDEPRKPKHKESGSHWAMGRVIGVTSAITLYMAIKYFAGKSYATLNDKAVQWARNAKWIPKLFRPSDKEVEYYLAEQIAAISATAVLSVSKDALDKRFPPDLVIEEGGKPELSHSSRLPERKPAASHSAKITEKRQLEEAAVGASYASV